MYVYLARIKLNWRHYKELLKEEEVLLYFKRGRNRAIKGRRRRSLGNEEVRNVFMSEIFQIEYSKVYFDMKNLILF